MKNEIDDFFEKPFIKEYLFNLQVNQKVSLVEFLFTRKVLILIGFACFLIWYNSDSASSQKYISIASVLILLYMFKNNRILKKEKYYVPIDNIKRDNNELVFHSFYNRAVKRTLKQKFTFLLPLLFISTQDLKAEFANNINTSTDTQNKNNEIYKFENLEMVNRSKIKNIYYLSQEKKIFLTKEINNQFLIESDLQANKTRINIEKSKNEITK